MSMARTIARRDRTRLASLLAQAGRQRKALDAILREAEAITGEGPFGHTFDAIWSDLGIRTDELLRRLEIDVEK